ncbi:hypothetical protein [Thioclava kandeliae]|uniref:DUF1376 domain-containing protein n=1 Tax=Thioclava kandeliae TaxID=3070818 RepID=A0ABV1SG33_9RHOB
MILSSGSAEGRNKAEAEILRRANGCLAAFYDPDMAPATAADLRREFVLALRELPLWAVHRGFDAWMQSKRRRPSPAEIAMEAKNAMEPYLREAARRKREVLEVREDEARAKAGRCSEESAARIMAACGFTAEGLDAVRRSPMASSRDQAVQERSESGIKHWSESADPEGLEWAACYAARAENTLIIEARAAQAKLSGMGDRERDEWLAARTPRTQGRTAGDWGTVGQTLGGEA